MMLLGSPAMKPYNIAQLLPRDLPNLVQEIIPGRTAFADAACTTPAVVEGPVAALLGTDQMLKLGPELIVNGDFSNGLTGWTVGAESGASVVNGVLNITRAVGATLYRVSKTLTVVIGRTYNLKFSVSNAQCGYRVINTAIAASTGTVKSHSLVFVPANTSVTVEFWAGIVDGATITGVDDVSVRELTGIHSFQPDAAKRPVLSALINRFINTQDFSKSNWTAPANWSVDNAAILAPDGTMTGIKITSVSAATTPYVTLVVQAPQNTYRMHLKDGTHVPRMVFRNNTTGVSIFSVDTSATSGSNAYGSWIVESADNGWKLITIKQTSGVTIGDSLMLYFGSGTAVTIGLYWYVWHPDFRPGNIGNILPPYQRVGDTVANPADYDTAGFPWYLKQPSSGIGGLQIGPIDYSAYRQMTAIVSARSESDAAAGVLLELGTAYGGTGCFGIQSPGGVAADIRCFSNGGTTRLATLARDASPVSMVATLQANIAAPSVRSTIDLDTVGAANVLDQGAGNYASAVLNRLSRNNATSAPFIGRDFGCVVTPAMLNYALLRMIKKLIARNAGRSL